MTMALIVAFKDRFYMVSDTLTSSDNCFTLNSKKSFVSEKHKVGMCIAGNANLECPDLSEGETGRVLYTNFVIKEFFQYLENMSQDNFSVACMEDYLESFFNEHYSHYFDFFRQNVSYFYGGFRGVDDEKEVVIFSHHVRQDGSIEEKSFPYSEDNEEACFFANTDAVKTYIDWTLKCFEAQGNTVSTPKELLTEYTNSFLMFTVPAACMHLNKDYPYSISKHLHCIEVTRDQDCIHSLIDYSTVVINPETQNYEGLPVERSQIDDPGCFNYLFYRSYKESNEAFMRGDLSKYSKEDGNQYAYSPPEQTNLGGNSAVLMPPPNSQGNMPDSGQPDTAGETGALTNG